MMGEKVIFMIRNARGDVINEEVRKQFALLEQILSCTEEDSYTSRNICWRE